jgi:hypothetical protein
VWVCKVHELHLVFGLLMDQKTSIRFPLLCKVKKFSLYSYAFSEIVVMRYKLHIQRSSLKSKNIILQSYIMQKVLKKEYEDNFKSKARKMDDFKSRMVLYLHYICSYKFIFVFKINVQKKLQN